jgi:hypothetical protein
MGITFSEMAEKWMLENIPAMGTPAIATEATKATEGVSAHEASTLTEVVVDEYGLGRWLVARCIFDRRWSTSLAALHRSFSHWRKEVGLPIPSVGCFKRMLIEADVEIDGNMIIGLALSEDVQAFMAMPANIDGMPAAEQLMPAPAHSMEFEFEGPDYPDGITLPTGVRLIERVPMSAPIQLSEHEVVTDVEKFVRTTTLQLVAHFNEGKSWLDGGWKLPQLLDRLKKCGVLVAINHAEQECPR